MTRDEIIKELRCLAAGEDCPSEKCDNTCPYWTEREWWAALYEDRQLCRAAADILEQDDRFADTGKMVPLTLDELDCLNVGVLGGVPIWIEHRSDGPNLLKWEFSGWQVLQGMERNCMLLNTDTEIGLRNFNKVWRCWKRQPTPEETANAPWEGTK